MGWETEKLDRTLFIVKTTVGGKDTFAIHPFCRVHKVSGETFMESLPAGEILSAGASLRFNKVEFIDPLPISGGKAPLAGDLALTNCGTDSSVMRGA